MPYNSEELPRTMTEEFVETDLYLKRRSTQSHKQLLKKTHTLIRQG